MGRRAKPAKVKAKATRPVVRKAPTKGAARVHELEQRLAESLEREKAKDRALTEALEQQTATAEILRVISRSQTDVQPVFDVIASSAVRLCDASFSGVFRFDGELIHLISHAGLTPAEVEAASRIFPMRAIAGRAGLPRTVLNRTIVHIPDITIDPEWRGPDTNILRGVEGYRCFLAVPLIHDSGCLGAINVWRRVPEPFSEEQIALLKTFADQAVIAIENARLFTELQTSNRELTTALDTQTATSDILRVISRSQTDVQPVFDAIVASAVRLLGGFSGGLVRVAGDRLELAAFTNTDPSGDEAVRSAFPQALHLDWPYPRVVRDRVLLNVSDMRSDPRMSEGIRNVAAARGYHSIVVLPMLRHDEAVGALSVTRRERGGFTDDEIGHECATLDSSPNAVGFYVKLGYTPVGPPDDDGAVPMRKALRVPDS